MAAGSGMAGNSMTNSDSMKQKEEGRRSSVLSSRELVLPLSGKSARNPGRVSWGGGYNAMHACCWVGARNASKGMQDRAL
jgi:hypothetical protein